VLEESLFPDEYQLCIERIEVEDQMIVVFVSSSSSFGICPNCQEASHRVHSFYQRRPGDLPFAAHPVRLIVTVRRFFCDNKDCELSIFAERMPNFVKPYARRTNRLNQSQLSVAFAAGGEGGARLLRVLRMPVSPDTLLRMIRSAPEDNLPTPCVLGVDDWAKKKGQAYGTILVDLEKRKPVDLLPDREATSLEKWLKAHPGVSIISRDRGTYYIKGATEGAPEAIQIADRWHLLKNLREALERLLEGKPDCLKAAAQEKPEKQSVMDAKTKETVTVTATANEESEQAPMEERELTQVEKNRLQRRKRREERYNTVKRLQQEGHSIREIARRTQMDPRTVSKYTKAEECPMYPVGIKRKNQLSPYKDYIRQRLSEGCLKATKIFNELREKGFSGSYCSVARFLRQEKGQMSGIIKPPKEPLPSSPRRSSWLLVKPPEELDEEEKGALQQMMKADGKVTEAYSLSQRFCSMIKERDCKALLPWLKDAVESGIDALKQFAKGIKQDIDAVTNALRPVCSACTGRYEWSNGQVEGQVNRLKLIKRQMYGRANFDLLRKRVLFNPI